ncbi:hypothetical protein BCO18430_06484 [Burkholderia contaminans]|nr:hypothetical protein BCO18430_06484 [Burkholderia contaminans]
MVDLLAIGGRTIGISYGQAMSCHQIVKSVGHCLCANLILLCQPSQLLVILYVEDRIAKLSFYKRFWHEKFCGKSICFDL